MLVITGPTGQIGSQLLAHLLTGDEPIRVIVRDPAKLSRRVRERVEIVQGSYAEPDVVMKAFEGADAVFWVPIAAPVAESAEAAFVDMSRPASEAIRRHRVKHVISVSALGRGWPKDAGYATASIHMDDMLAATGASFRALACPSLMDNMLRQAALIRNHGMFYLPVAGDFRTPPRKKARANARDRSMPVLHGSRPFFHWTPDMVAVPCKGAAARSPERLER